MTSQGDEGAQSLASSECSVTMSLRTNHVLTQLENPEYQEFLKTTHTSDTNIVLLASFSLPLPERNPLWHHGMGSESIRGTCAGLDAAHLVHPTSDDFSRACLPAVAWHRDRYQE